MITDNHRVRTDQPEFDKEAQQAARDAIMEIDQFPELERRVIDAFGPRAEAIMIHQLVYWFRKPAYQDSWTVYMTRDNWHEQRGINRDPLDDARERLRHHPSGVVTEKLGPYKRVHYRIDWVALAEALSVEVALRPPLKPPPMDVAEDDSLRPPLKAPPKPSAPPLGATESSAPPQTDDAPDTYAENSPNGGGTSNIEDYAGDFSQEREQESFTKDSCSQLGSVKETEANSQGPRRESYARKEGRKTKRKSLPEQLRDLLDPEVSEWDGAEDIAEDPGRDAMQILGVMRRADPQHGKVIATAEVMRTMKPMTVRRLIDGALKEIDEKEREIG